ncbi:hypothetical protein [Candidatus Chrysopegis kryptomonas]|jgi:hypothetical protein|uniref:Uncharacterized protein n=1 Tax=Candidatus Chryseopegocella kryptomonas TaxID=1633643 RepID=A0A0P1P284_9BACT|nr:hypothetical protein [Candidatus Chrysopegis kryptomonas]CUT04985.1 hypothetical protein JGI23_01853 [Candidatus Chrysopegis kryptomonas]
MEEKNLNLPEDICKEIENLIKTANLTSEEKIKLWNDVAEFISKWIEMNIEHHEGG